MTDFPILRNLGYILFTAAVAVLLLRTIRVPTIIAYMAAGLLLGPVTGVLAVSDPIELLSEIGIALLLFLVGLELSLEHIRGVGRVAVVGGVIQIATTALLGWGLAALFGLGGGAATVVALSVTFSSTVVVVKLLGQKRDLSALYGRIAVGILLVQDVAVVLALTLFAGLRGDADADAGSMAAGIGAAFGGMIGLALAAAAASRYVLPWLFARVQRAPDIAFIWSLAWCFLFILAAELVHLSVELGAFIAGVSLAQLHFAETLRRRVQPIVNFFLAVFFVSLGLQMEPGAAVRQWPLVLAISAAVLLAKPLILMLTVPRLGYGARTTFLTGVTLAQMSEFSFILAALAASSGMLGQEILSVISVAGFLTIGISAYLVMGSERLYPLVQRTGLLRLLGAESRQEEAEDEPLSGHVIVVGMNTLGRRLAEQLTARGETVLAIDTDPVKLEELDERYGTTLLGTVDDMAVLEQASFAHAKLVVSALQIEDTNLLLAHRCRQAEVPVSVHAFDTSLIDELREVGATHLMVSKHDGTRRIADELRRAGVLD